MPPVTRISPAGQVEVKLTSGRQARSYRDEEDRRRYGPFRVRLEVQLSPLSVTSDALDFYLYQEDGEKAIAIAFELLKVWHQADRFPFDGYPKPVGQGYATPIADKEFRDTWKQALNEGKNLLRNGDRDDPLAFHIKPITTRIIFTP